MLDRQDIDALLVGALYGELSPDESSRLDQHLSAHPQDRLVLDGLGRARQALRDSHFLTAQVDPPAAVSALLLQEAARRAPEPRTERAGFFAKLTALLRHPAMAATAVLVLVVGVAGTLYLRNGEHAMAPYEAAPMQTPPALEGGLAFDETDRAGGERTQAATGQPQVPAGPVAGAGSAAAAPDDDAYRADLDLQQQVATDSKAKDGKLAATERAKPTSRPQPGQTGSRAKNEASAAEAQRENAPTIAGAGSAPGRGEAAEDRAANKKRGYVEVTTPDPQPKTLEDSNTAATGVASGGAKTSGVPADPAGTADKADAPRAGAAMAPAPPPETTTATSSTSADVAARRAADLAAAKSQHANVVALVKSNKCRDAAKAAANLFERYRDYYGEFVANDRQVKACRSYIEVERKKRSEAAKSRSRAYQDSEAPAPTTSK